MNEQDCFSGEMIGALLEIRRKLIHWDWSKELLEEILLIIMTLEDEIETFREQQGQYSHKKRDDAGWEKVPVTGGNT